MPYHVGEKKSNGCSGYPVVSADGKVMGCHPTKEHAVSQVQALYANEPGLTKEYQGCGCPTCKELNVTCENCPVCQSEAMKMDCCGGDMSKAKKPNYDNMIKPRKGGSDPANPRLYARIIQEAKDKFDTYPSAVANGWVVQEYKRRGGTYKVMKSESKIQEGDFVMGMTVDGVAHGRVEHIMWDGGILGIAGSEYSLQSNPPSNPAMSVRLYEQEDDGKWSPTPYSIGMMYQDAEKLDNLEGHQMDKAMNISKSETYTPTAGMKSAARRALKWKEDGKATGAGTPVGWGRATDIVAGRSMSLSVVKRMYSFFSRHEVDKKGKDFYNTSNPSNGRIMWDAWGGDAGFAWSRKIVQREANKMWEGSAFEAISKRQFNTAQRERMASSGQAMPDGSYPIANRTDLMNAIRSWGRGGADPKVKEHIKRRARALGAADMIPENWK